MIDLTLFQMVLYWVYSAPLLAAFLVGMVLAARNYRRARRVARLCLVGFGTLALLLLTQDVYWLAAWRVGKHAWSAANLELIVSFRRSFEQLSISLGPLLQTGAWLLVALAVVSKLSSSARPGMPVAADSTDHIES